MIADTARLPNGNGVGLVMLAGLHVDLLHAGSQCRLSFQLQTKHRLIHEPFAVKIDCVSQIVHARLEGLAGIRVSQDEYDLAVG